MSTFKKGDLVKCVHAAYGCLDPTKTYEVQDVVTDPWPMLMVDGLLWVADRFTLDTEAMKRRQEATQKATVSAYFDAETRDLMKRPASDPVVQPHHYARFTIEPATFIGANKLPFDVGAIIKYVCRYDAKNGKEDVKKAKRFCEMLLERIEREERIAAGESAQDVWKVML